jgi:hypothetical protein
MPDRGKPSDSFVKVPDIDPVDVAFAGGLPPRTTTTREKTNTNNAERLSTKSAPVAKHLELDALAV